MGDTISEPVKEVKVEVGVEDADDDATAKIELYEDGAVVQTDEPNAADRRWEIACTPKAGKHYYFAKVTQGWQPAVVSAGLGDRGRWTMCFRFLLFPRSDDHGQFSHRPGVQAPHRAGSRFPPSQWAEHRAFVALHEFQNLHRLYKDRISRFVMGYFFPSYSFDLDKTLYFFTSGRYEFRNKGFDLVVESLARLNYRLKQEGSDKTMVCFFITQKPYTSINPDVLSSRALLEEIWRTCESIQEHVGERLFEASATGQVPKLDTLVDEYWRLRLRRNVLAWRSSRQPYIVTHNLVDHTHDELLNMLRTCGLLNHRNDPVKVVYHPEFIPSRTAHEIDTRFQP